MPFYTPYHYKGTYIADLLFNRFCTDNSYVFFKVFSCIYLPSPSIYLPSFAILHYCVFLCMFVSFSCNSESDSDLEFSLDGEGILS